MSNLVIIIWQRKAIKHGTFTTCKRRLDIPIVGVIKSERERKRPNFKYGRSQLIRSRKQVSHGRQLLN